MCLWWSVLVASGVPFALAAQGGTTRVLLISGLSGEAQFAREFASEAGAIDDMARAQWHVADSNLVYLAEDPAADKRISGKSTRENVEASFAAIARRVVPGDVVLVVLIGHGSGEMGESSVNLPGPDPTANDYAGWLKPLDRATIVFANTATASGDFAAVLAGPNRVIISSTRTAMERNASIFGDFFAKALASTDADADKDGRVSVAEAFTWARDQVAKAYESTNRMQTEHPTLVDSSGIAAGIAFGGEAASADPRVIALVGARRILEARVDSLRRAKATMDSTAYSKTLEDLLLQIAAKTQAIRQLQGGAKP
jgi:hypothetical protein